VPPFLEALFPLPLSWPPELARCAVGRGGQTGIITLTITLSTTHPSVHPQEEAFAIWLEWSALYPAGSESRAFIRELADTRWLVSVAHHDFKDEHGLWNWLLDDDRGDHGDKS
jgi:hypothetical protein